MHGNHLKSMATAGGGLFAVLLIFGVPLGRALGYAVSLACPLMMVGMMVMMGRGHGRGHDGHAGLNADGAEQPPHDGNEHAST